MTSLDMPINKQSLVNGLSRSLNRNWHKKEKRKKKKKKTDISCKILIT